MELRSLEDSATYSPKHRKIELELIKLFCAVFEQTLAEKIKDINVYGIPYSGSLGLINRYLASNGINSLKSGAASVNKDNLKYLVKALSYNNQKRGVHLLATFIRCFWGTEFIISQLYQRKNGVYPRQLETLESIKAKGLRESDFFLTSRIRITLLGGNIEFPTELSRLLNNVVPARIFLDDTIRTIPVNARINFKADTHVRSMVVVTS